MLGRHTMLGDTLGDADDEGNLSLNGLLNTGGSQGGTVDKVLLATCVHVGGQ